jgi:PAS domain S-box-containing protein
MKRKAGASTKGLKEKNAALTRQLHEAQERLRELAGGNAHAGLPPGGPSRAGLAATESAVLNALPANVAVIDREGVILSVNEGWRRSVAGNALDPLTYGPGRNYVEVCEQAQQKGDADARAAAAGIRAILSGASTGEFLLEYPCHSPAEERWFLLRVNPIGKDGPGGAVIMHVNITEQKKRENAARESDERFRSMFITSTTGMAISTPHGRYLEANAAYCRMLGYTREELLTRDFASLTHPEDLTLNLKLRDELLAGLRESFVMEKRYLKKNGDIVWTRHSVSATHSNRGEIATLMVVAEDITERKSKEAALEVIRTRHRALFDNMLEGYVYCRLLYDEQGRARDYIYLETNDAFGPQTGLGNVIGKKVSEVVPGMHEANPEQLEIYSRVAATGRPERFESYAKPMEIWFSVSVYSQEKEHFIAVFENITERKQNEERLRKSEKLLAEAEALGRIGSWERDLTSGQVNRSAEFYRILGLDPKENTADSLDHEKIIYPEDYAGFLQVRQAILLGQEVRDWEFRIIHPNRGVRDMRLRVAFERDEEGRAVRIYGTIKDITEEKQAEKSLLLFRTSIDKSNDIIWMLDSATLDLLDFSQSACASLGYSREELLSMSIFDLDPDVTRSMHEEMKGVLRTAGRATIESRLRRKDGSTFPIEGSLNRVHLDKDYDVCVIRDITNRKRAEEALAATEHRYRQLFAALPAAVYTCDAEGRITLFNDAAVKLWGREPEIGSDDWSGAWRLYASDGAPLPFGDSPMAVAIREERSIRGVEVIVERPDGSRSYVLPQVDPLRDTAGVVVGSVNMLFDLTERRRGEEALRQSGEELRALARRIEFIREEQVVRIARELHDVLGQALTMLKLLVLSLQRQLEQYTGEPTTIESREALELIHQAIQNVRDLCVELRPPVLDHLGLGPAIETLAAHFRTHSGISCVVSGAANLPVMETQRQIAAYRIVQELLTNVARHSGASGVRIVLRVKGGTIEIEVADNGRGIRATEVTGIRSLGLLGMRERALAAGGSITIKGRPGGGSIGTVRLPIAQPGETS